MQGIVLIVFDEIGLAEISPHNPLKVLHALIEDPSIAFLGISNWSLDASKMARGLTLNRPHLEREDLLETAQSISHELIVPVSSMHFGRYFTQIIDIYLEYLETLHQIKYKHYENFHGTRDFYFLIKYIC